jgi:hypothetical protein
MLTSPQDCKDADFRMRHERDPADYAEAIKAIGEWLAACPRTTNADPIMLAELALEGADLDFTDDGDGWNFEQAMDDLSTYSPQLNAAMARVRAAKQVAA